MTIVCNSSSFEVGAGGSWLKTNFGYKADVVTCTNKQFKFPTYESCNTTEEMGTYVLFDSSPFYGMGPITSYTEAQVIWGLL